MFQCGGELKLPMSAAAGDITFGHIQNEDTNLVSLRKTLIHKVAHNSTTTGSTVKNFLLSVA
jgi:hypothetical protein